MLKWMLRHGSVHRLPPALRQVGVNSPTPANSHCQAPPDAPQIPALPGTKSRAHPNAGHVLRSGTLRHREDLKFLKQKLKKLEDKLGKDRSKAGELEAEVASLQQDVPRLQARAEELAVQLKAAEEVGRGWERSEGSKQAGGRGQQELKKGGLCGQPGNVTVLTCCSGMHDGLPGMKLWAWLASATRLARVPGA
jgi:hypothetical protein